MDFEKLKDFAKTATEKTKDSIAKANEKRRKANQETKIFLPAPTGMASAHTIRKNIEGQYYLGGYSETPVLFEFAGFEFAGSKTIERTTTKSKTKQQGRTGSVLGGAAIGSILAPGVGTIVGGMAGGTRKKKEKLTLLLLPLLKKYQVELLLNCVILQLVKLRQFKQNLHKLKLTMYSCSF